MRSKAPSALLLLEHQARTFVVTFGHAWLKLKDEWVERDFGLRVALNAMPKDEVVELRSEQVFAKWHLASERAPRAASVDEFGVDFDRDLVAVVEGVPRPSTGLGATVRGSTSLRVKLPMSSLLTTLDTALNFYGSDAFRKDWPDIDRVNVVTDKTVIPVLEQQLDGDLKDDKRRRRIVMFTPSEKRGDSIVADSYVYGSLTKNAPSRPYMTIENWANEIAGKHLVPSVAQAKQSKVHMFEDLNGQQWTHSAFECFGYETSIGGQVYVLSSGVWYEVASDFIARINARILNIPKPQEPLPKWNQTDSEAQYNQKCALDRAFLNCDKQVLRYGGGNSQFEFCDVIHMRAKTLYFAKIVSRSSGMSHLTEQVRRTAQLLFSTDDGYRKELMGRFAKYHANANVKWLKERPRQGDWVLCMVSLGKPTTSLPFFAKCGLANVYKDLLDQGHRIAFMHV